MFGLPIGYVGELDEVELGQGAGIINMPGRELYNQGSPLANGVAASITPNKQFTYNPLLSQQTPRVLLPFDYSPDHIVVRPEGWTGHYPERPFDQAVSDLEGL